MGISGEEWGRGCARVLHICLEFLGKVPYARVRVDHPDENALMRGQRRMLSRVV